MALQLKNFKEKVSAYKNNLQEKKNIDNRINRLIIAAFLIITVAIYFYIKQKSNDFLNVLFLILYLSFWIIILVTDFFKNLVGRDKYKIIKREITSFENEVCDYYEVILNAFYLNKLYRKRSKSKKFQDNLQEFESIVCRVAKINEVFSMKSVCLNEYIKYILRRKSMMLSLNNKTSHHKKQSKSLKNINKLTQLINTKEAIWQSPENKYRKPVKINWEAVNKKNQEIGLFGEKIVVDIEKEYLASIGREDLVENVKHISAEIGDGAGFDVLSFFKDGSRKYIEVKTTKKTIGAPYFISRNELNFLQENIKNAFVYRVSISDDNITLHVQRSDEFFKKSKITPTQYSVKQ